MDLIFNTPNIEDIFQRAFERILFGFDSSTRMFISLVIMYIFGIILISFFSLSEPNSKIVFWIKKSKTMNGFYELSMIIIFIILVIKWVQSTIDIEDMINLDTADILLIAQIFPITIGLMFHTVGSLIISLDSKRLINANKIILDLNSKIIFYEEKE